MYKTIITLVCVLLLLCGSPTGSVGAYQAVVTYSVDGIDLDTGEIEQDRTLLWLLMGASIDDMLQAPVFPTDFSPSVDISFRFGQTSQSAPTTWLVLKDEVQVAVVPDCSFDELLFSGGLPFSGIPPEIPIDQNSVLVAWTAENRYFKLGHFHSRPDFQLAFDIEEIPIPESSTLLLLGAGLLGFLGLARRHTLFLLLFVVLILGAILNAQPLYAEDPIRIQKAGPGSGTVFAGAEACDAACDGLSLLYDEGTAILLKAVADEGSWFDRWVTPEGSTLSRTFTPQPGDTVVAVFATELPSSGGSVSIAEGAVTVTIPEGAVDGPISVSLTEVLFAPSEFSTAYDIRVYTPEGTPVTQFEPALTITMAYDPEATSGTFVYQPVLHSYDEAAGQWVPIPSTVDYDAHTVTASTTHLTIFELRSPFCGPSCQVALSDPPDGSRTNDPTPTYSWKRGTFDCERYCLEVLQTDVGDYRLIGKKVEDCYLASSLICSATSCEVTPGAYLDGNNEYNWNSLPEGSYRWRVKTWEPTGEDDFVLPTGEVVKKGYGEWSAPRSFTIDTTPPTPGNEGQIELISIAGLSVSIGWGMASDGIPPSSENLTYRVYYSTSAQLDTLAEIEAATPGSTWIAGQTYTADIDLPADGEYYFNVLAQDEARNMAPYTKLGPISVSSGVNACEVTSSADSGDGSLRQVLASAEDNNCSTITFADEISQINLVEQLTIPSTSWLSGTLTIDGVTANGPVTISGQNQIRVFWIESNVAVTFENLIITEGYVTGTSCPAACGGGIYNNGGIANIEDGSDVNGNTAGWRGGGIYNNAGTLTVNGTISGNIVTDTLNAYGGGIFNDGGMLTVNGAVSSNTANNGVGGGIATGGGRLTVNGTVSDNSAAMGGGIDCNRTITVINGTVSDNSAIQNGGGISLFFGPFTLNGTVIGNTAANDGGGIYIWSGATGPNNIAAGSRVNNNTASTGLGGGIYDLGYEMIGGATTSTVYGNIAHGCNDYYRFGVGCVLPPPCLVTTGADYAFGEPEITGSLRQVLADFGNGECSSPLTFASSVSTVGLERELEISSLTLTIDGGSGVTVRGNISSQLVKITRGTNVEFQNLTIQNDAGGGIVVDYGDYGSSMVTISGGSITGGYNGNGVDVWYGGNTVNLTDVTVSGNRSGLTIDSDSSVTISGGSVTGTTDNGIYVWYGGTVDLTDVRVSGLIGLEVAAASARVSGGSITGTAGDGVLVGSGGEVENISNATIEGADYAIRCTSFERVTSLYPYTNTCIGLASGCDFDPSRQGVCPEPLAYIRFP